MPGHRDISPPPSGLTAAVIEGASSPWRPDAFAVIVGIDQYKDSRIPNLRFARKDAEAIHQVLTDPAVGRFNPDNVITLLDEDATERKIRSALGTKLPRRTSRGSTVCIYYAGHGAPDIDVDAQRKSADNIEKYLVPHDAEVDDLRSTAISMDSIQQYVSWLDAKQVICFFDTCYSGAAGGRSFERDLFRTRAIFSDEHLDRLAGEGRVVITACATNEVSLESLEKGHGLFTYYLVRGLKGEADHDQDGRVTVDELYDYVYHHVERDARSMDGRMSPLRKGSVRGRVYLTQYKQGLVEPFGESEPTEPNDEPVIVPSATAVQRPMRRAAIAAAVTAPLLAILAWLWFTPTAGPSQTDAGTPPTPAKPEIGQPAAPVATPSPVASPPPKEEPAARGATTPSKDEPAARGATTPPKSEPAARGATTRPAALPYVPGQWKLPSNDNLGFVLIDAGSFLMGSADLPGALIDERPQAQVQLPAFFMARYEVTVDQYKACVDDSGACKNASQETLNGPVDRPVRFISWNEAVAYCNWLDSKLRSWSGTPGPIAAALSGANGGPAWKVRLPSEAEWEKAARGTTNRLYPWGDALDPAKANYGNRLKEPTIVGIFPEGASPYGLRDMSGNVWEWTRSRQFRYPYRANNDREDTRPTKDAPRVIRGGSFLTDDPRATRRNTGEQNSSADFIGFRVAIGPPQ